MLLEKLGEGVHHEGANFERGLTLKFNLLPLGIRFSQVKPLYRLLDTLIFPNIFIIVSFKTLIRINIPLVIGKVTPRVRSSLKHVWHRLPLLTQKVEPLTF